MKKIIAIILVSAILLANLLVLISADAENEAPRENSGAVAAKAPLPVEQTKGGAATLITVFVAASLLVAFGCAVIVIRRRGKSEMHLLTDDEWE